MKRRIDSFLIGAAAISVAAACPTAHAGELSRASAFPDRPIRWIVPFPPGGSNDILGRYLGAKLGERVGQQVVIDNRAGANGIIGTDLASRATPDGYTLLMVSTSFVMNAALRKLPYDVDKSFEPVSMIGSAPNCIVVFPGLGVNTLAELVERARAQPGKLNYASTGVGGFNHFGGELFKRVAKVDLVHIPYRGGGPAMTDIMAGQVPVMFSSLTQVLPNVRNNRMKLLAVGADKRSPVVPDVPTVAEAGYPGYEVAVWWGIVVPAGTPNAVRDKLRREVSAVLSDDETRKRLLADAAEPVTMAPAEMRALFREDVKKWSGVAKAASIAVLQ